MRTHDKRGSKKIISPLTINTLETKYLFPLLDARPDDYPNHNEQLIQTQLHAINMLRTWFCICHNEQSLTHALALTFACPHLRRVWTSMQDLGFATPLDDANLTRLAA